MKFLLGFIVKDNKANPYGLLAILFVVLILLMGVKSCSDSRAYKDSLKYMELQDSLLQTEVSRLNDYLGREQVKYQVAQITHDQLATSKSDEVAYLRQRLKDSDIRYKNLLISMTIRQTTTDSIEIEVRDTLFKFVPVTSPQLPIVPIAARSKLEWSDDWLTLNGTANFTKFGEVLTFDGVSLSYALKNELIVDHAYERKNIFSPKTLSVMFTSQNPNTTTNSVQVYSIKDQKKWYEKWWVHELVGFTVGATSGYLITR